MYLTRGGYAPIYRPARPAKSEMRSAGARPVVAPPVVAQPEPSIFIRLFLVITGVALISVFIATMVSV